MTRTPCAALSVAVTLTLAAGCGVLPGGRARAEPRAPVVVTATRAAPAAHAAPTTRPGLIAKSVPVVVAPADDLPGHGDFRAAAGLPDAPREVNAFGEFDGAPLRPGRAMGAAGFAQLTFADEGYDADVTLAPGGGELVFASTRHADRADLYRQRVGSPSVTQLTADPADDAFPAYSRDGRRIAFASNRAGTWDIYTMTPEGKDVTQVTNSAAHDLHPTFSPDGRTICFSRYGGRSGRWELWTVGLDGGELKMVGFGLFPDWSPRPDKDVIAYQRARQRGTRWFSLWTLELRGGEPLAPTEVAVSTNAAIVAPSWSPDGTELAFATVIEPGGMAGAGAEAAVGGQQDVWVVDADGSGRRRLTDGIGTNATPHWADDGRVYFVSDRGGNECVWSAAAEPPAETLAEIETEADLDAGASATLPTE